MAFKFIPGEGLETGFRRIAVEEIERALLETRPGADPAAAVHSARKRCKRLRGLIRLVRPAFPNFAKENAALREAAASLSEQRDAQVLLESLGKLIKGLPQEHGEALAPVSAFLQGRVAPDPGAEEQHENLKRFGWAMQTLQGRARTWTLEDDRFAPVRAGLVDTVDRMQRAMARAARTGRAEDFHDWRKQAKYHWHHLCLLRSTAPHVLSSPRDAASSLADLLGEHHDLAVLSELLLNEPAASPSGVDMAPLRDLIGDEMQRLALEALSIGRELSAETPEALGKRFSTYWKNASLRHAA